MLIYPDLSSTYPPFINPILPYFNARPAGDALPCKRVPGEPSERTSGQPIQVYIYDIYHHACVKYTQYM